MSDLIDLSSDNGDNVISPHEQDEEELHSLDASLRSAQSKDDALRIAVAAAELSMRSLRLAKDPAIKSALHVKLDKLLEQAEHVKHSSWPPPEKPLSPNVKNLAAPQSTRKQLNSELIVIYKSSYLNDHKFVPWKSDPDPSLFDLEDGEPLFTDPTTLTLSARQLEHLSGWRRPGGSALRADTAAPVDLVQDVATDCSVVASLATAIARTARGHDDVLRGSLYPTNAVSANGRYIARLNFNGVWRKVEIDNLLPCSDSSRTIHVVDRNNPQELWPALLEKACLKIRGGYDFPGSNSATDLWILTGWVPEQLFVQDNMCPIQVWDRVFKAHQYGDVLITLGTGKMSDLSQHDAGLADEHDYAVLDLRQVDDKHQMLIKNTWLDVRQDLNDGVWATHDSGISSTFWIDIHSIYQHFESIYLNWNPGLFTHRQDIHFAYKTSSRQVSLFVDSPQFTFSTEEGGVAWILLARHLDQVQDPFISLHLFDMAGRILTNQKSVAKAPFVDSPQTLLRLADLKPRHSYTLVPVQDGPETLSSFSVHAFANSPIHLERSVDEYSHEVALDGAWDEFSAGGNANSPTYSHNPQFRLDLSAQSPSILVLGADADTPVHLKVVHGQGQRVHQVRARDVIVDSGDYTRGYALASYNFSPGIYTVIVSTFERDCQGKFKLRLLTPQIAARLDSIPRDGAGRICHRLATAAFQPDQQRVAAPLLPLCITKFAAVVHQAQQSMVRVTVECGSGPERNVLVASGDGGYSDTAQIRTEEIELSPDMARQVIWLVIERVVIPSRPSEGFFDVDILVGVPKSVSVGVWRRFDD